MRKGSFVNQKEEPLKKQQSANVFQDDNTIFLSDGEENRGGEQEDIVDNSRQGEFVFDPNGQENLKKALEQEQLAEEQAAKQKIIEEEESKEDSGGVSILTQPSVREETLQMLADENISMKEDLELKLN